jgi:hypothetical protein
LDLISLSLALNQGEGQAAVWAGVGSGLALVLLTIGAIIFLVVCRRRTLGPGINGTGSDADMPKESPASSTEDDTYMSGENALGSDDHELGQIKLDDDRDEGLGTIGTLL